MTKLTSKKHKKNPVISLSVLPGEPTDGSGKVCIHLLVPDEHGQIIEDTLHPVFGEDGQQMAQKVQLKSTRCRLACDVKKIITPVIKNGVMHITMRTDNPEAVTCLKCKRSKEYLNHQQSEKI